MESLIGLGFFINKLKWVEFLKIDSGIIHTYEKRLERAVEIS